MAKIYAQVVGAVLILIGILGFLKVSLLGAPNTLHDIIHVVSGAWGAYAGYAGGLGGPKTFAQIFGVIYTIVAVLGFIGAANFIMVSGAGNFVHLVIGVLGLYVGFVSK